MISAGVDAAGGTPSIDCRQMGFRYPDAPPLFDQLSLRIPARGFFGLFGPSGVGKTTLARLLTGLIRPTTGRISSAGVRLYTHSNERLPGWTPLGSYLSRLAPNPVAGRNVTEWMARFGLDACRHRTFGHLSKGQQNRANLLRYLLLEFRILVMDESLANVDATMRHRIIADMAAIYPDRAFVYISHHVSDVTRFCRHILVLRPGSAAVSAVWVDGVGGSDGSADPNHVLVEILNGL